MGGASAGALALALGSTLMLAATNVAALPGRDAEADDRYVPASRLRDAGVVVVQADRPFTLWSGERRLGESDATATFRIVANPGLLALEAVGLDEERKAADVVVEAGRIHPVAFYFGGGVRKVTPPESASTEWSVPKLVKKVDPEYPMVLRMNGVQGEVVLECLITDEGNVMISRVLESIPELDEAALAAVRDWKYEPARYGGVPQAVYLKVKVTYRLPASQQRGATPSSRRRQRVRPQ